MYRGFNLSVSNQNSEYLYNLGLEILNSYQTSARKIISDFISTDGSINGSSVQKNWFPEINADVFISHSHNDEKQAITLSGWLYKNFGIKSFIDSCIWGYSNDLLRQIDKKYCLQPSGFYNYNLRNQSTSHVHTMLSTALTMMIDKTECLFFLNTPESISASTVVTQTESPWIYFELTTSKFIRKKIPRRLDEDLEKSHSISGISESFDKLPPIRYNADLEHLKELNIDDLNKWYDTYSKIKSDVSTSKDALNKLYKLNPLYGR